MLRKKSQLSIKNIIQLNSLYYISLFAVMLSFSGFYLYKLQKETVKERLIRVQVNIKKNLDVEFHSIAKNLYLLKGYFDLIQDQDPQKKVEFFSRLSADAIHDQRVQYNSYFALEKSLAQKYFGKDGFIVTNHRNPELVNRNGYLSSKTFVQEIFTDASYQKDPSEVWYHIAKKSTEVEFSEIYFDSTYMKKWMATAGLGIYDKDGKFEGMVGIDILLDELVYQVEEARLGRTGGALLVDTRSGRILTRLRGLPGNFIQVNERYEKPEMTPEEQASWQELLNNSEKGGVRYFKGDNGDQYLVSVAPIAKVPWSLLVFQEYYEAYRPMIWQISMICFIGVFGLIVLILSSIRFGRLVNEPLQNLIVSLIQNIRSARRNEIMKIEVPKANYREVQRLSRLVNTLIRVVNSSTRRHFRAVEEQRAKALHSSRMASIGQMAGNVAHEINSPLATLSLQAEVLIKELQVRGNIEPASMNRMKMIQQMTERIAKIVRGFLALSREGTKDPLRLHSLSEIIEETMIVSHSRLSAYGLQLIIDEIPNVQITCRSVQISQVLLNLFNNARDAIGDLDEKWIKVQFQQVPGRIRILVTDSGKGIPKEISEKIMEPFFTTKDVNKGTGLGLSISKSIMEEHGGNIYYDASSANTRFVVELPTA